MMPLDKIFTIIYLAIVLIAIIVIWANFKIKRFEKTGQNQEKYNGDKQRRIMMLKTPIKICMVALSVMAIILMIAVIFLNYNRTSGIFIVVYSAALVVVLFSSLVRRTKKNKEQEQKQTINKEIKLKQIAYFDELLKNGTITQEEYSEKVREIQNK